MSFIRDVSAGGVERNTTTTALFVAFFQEIEENMYCDGCEAFGHLTYADTCPIVQQEATMIIFIDSKGSTPSKRKQKNKSKSNN